MERAEALAAGVAELRPSGTSTPPGSTSSSAASGPRRGRARGRGGHGRRGRARRASPVSAGRPVALYDKLRATSGGIGAAALRQRRCEGCRLELNTDRHQPHPRRADDEVLRCEECRRILVRTSESGL